MRRGTPHRASRGFTLIELIVTFSLVAVMLVLAAPSFVRYQRNSELTTVANDFIAAVSAARAEAMKSQRYTIVKPLSGDDWATGWVVFVDTDKSATLTTGDVTITRHEAMPSTVTVNVGVDAPAFDNSGTKYISFNGSGFLRLSGGSFPSTSALDVTNTVETRRIIVSPAGRMRVCKPTDDGCTIASL